MWGKLQLSNSLLKSARRPLAEDDCGTRACAALCGILLSLMCAG
jgi:hypothetical protein